MTNYVSEAIDGDILLHHYRRLLFEETTRGVFHPVDQLMAEVTLAVHFMRDDTGFEQLFTLHLV